MHFDWSYTTGPKAVFCSAPTGQTETQVGSAQCMQSRLLYLSPKVFIVVSLWAERRSSAPIFSLYGRLHFEAQACSQARHPMQRVLSYKMALLILFATFHMHFAIHGELERQEELPSERAPLGGGKCCGRILDRTSAIGSGSTHELWLPRVKRLYRAAHPVGNKALRQQVAPCIVLVWHMYYQQPSTTVGVRPKQRRIFGDLAVHFDHFSFDRRHHLNLLTLARKAPRLLTLPDPLAGPR